MPRTSRLCGAMRWEEVRLSALPETRAESTGLSFILKFATASRRSIQGCFSPQTPDARLLPAVAKGGAAAIVRALTGVAARRLARCVYGYILFRTHGGHHGHLLFFYDSPAAAACKAASTGNRQRPPGRHGDHGWRHCRQGVAGERRW